MHSSFLLLLLSIFFSIFFLSFCGKHLQLDEDDTKFEVEFVSTGHSFTREQIRNERGNIFTEEVEMISPKDGKKYLCRVPKSTTEEEKEIQRQKEKEELENADLNVEKLLAPLFEHCLYRIAGWFTYEFCPGRHFRQYHDEKGAVTQEYFLGRGPPNNNNLVANSLTQDPISQGLATTSYYKEVYEGGTTCDLTGEGRKTEIQYHCNPGENKLNFLSSVKEPASCQYLAVVETPLLCTHPLFRPKQEYADKIVCYPVE